MKTVVITGSGRGFGLEMLKVFRKNNFNCVVCDVNEEVMDEAKTSLEAIPGKGEVYLHPIDVTNYDSINKLIEDYEDVIKQYDDSFKVRFLFCEANYIFVSLICGFVSIVNLLK